MEYFLIGVCGNVKSMQKGMYVLSGFETNLESRHLRFINISHFSQLQPDFLFHFYS